MTRFFWKKLPRLALGAVVVLVGMQGNIGQARSETPNQVASAPEWTTELRKATSGGFLFEASVGKLRVTNAMHKAGEMTIAITDGSETVKLRMEGARVVATAPGRSVTLSLSGSLNEASARQITALVRESRVIQAFHNAIKRQRGLEGTRLHPNLAITDALLRSLAGDRDAPNDLHRQLAGSRASGVRPVRFAVDESCYEKWEGDVHEAWVSYEDCLQGMKWWSPLVMGPQACAFRYALWAESLWFELLACIAFPFLA